jgi:hypothetical protein
LAHTKYLILDEKSTVSLKGLSHIDFRLQQAKNNDLPFGGISILLFGDFWQLPPVLDKALYMTEQLTGQLRYVPPPMSSQVCILLQAGRVTLQPNLSLTFPS